MFEVWLTSPHIPLIFLGPINGRPFLLLRSLVLFGLSELNTCEFIDQEQRGQSVSTCVSRFLCPDCRCESKQFKLGWNRCVCLLMTGLSKSAACVISDNEKVETSLQIQPRQEATSPNRCPGSRR